MFDPELESFKTSIDLRAYAASQSYVLDAKESWRGSAVMRNEAGDKIIVKRDMDGHYVYFSVRDDQDHGTIIDFVCRRLGLSLGRSAKGTEAMDCHAAINFAALPRTGEGRERSTSCLS